MTATPFPPFPDVPESEGSVLELAAAAHVTGIPFGPDDPTQTAGQRRTYGVTVVGSNVEDLVKQHGAVVATSQVGGVDQGWQTRARISLEVYADSYGAAWAAYDAVRAHLTSGYRRTPDGALRIDSWKNESAPIKSMHPPLFNLVSTWRITTRDL